MKTFLNRFAHEWLSVTGLSRESTQQPQQPQRSINQNGNNKAYGQFTKRAKAFGVRERTHKSISQTTAALSSFTVMGEISKDPSQVYQISIIALFNFTFVVVVVVVAACYYWLAHRDAVMLCAYSITCWPFSCLQRTSFIYLFIF